MTRKGPYRLPPPKLTEAELRECRPTRMAENPLDDLNSNWQRKGATLSDKTARKEFGLTQNEIVQAISAGELQYRRGSIQGNPFLRLLRPEVEALVKQKHRDGFLKDQKAKAEMARINSELKRRIGDHAEQSRDARRKELSADMVWTGEKRP